MQRMSVIAVLFAITLSLPARSAGADRALKKADDEPLVVKAYPVADVVLSLGDKREPQFRALERHLRELTGPDVWKTDCSIQPNASTLSLVIRQTNSVHTQISEEIRRLRRQLDAMTNLAFYIITGPRAEIAALAEAFPGELGRDETKQLLSRVKLSKKLACGISPKITSFSKQTAEVRLNGRTITTNSTISADRRSVRLKISDRPEKSHDVLGNVEIVTVHSGRSIAVRFEAPVNGSIIPPPADADERLLVVTPVVVVAQEEEELLGLPRP